MNNGFMEDWDMSDWQSHIRPGDIVVFYDKDDNSPYHYSRPGRVVRQVQSFYRDGDPSVIHVALAVGPNPEQPKPGYTSLLIFDALIGHRADARPLARDYQIKIFRLKDKTFTGKRKDGSEYTFSTKDIQETAYAVAMIMRGIKYGTWTCWEVVRNRATRESSHLDFFYTQWLMQRFHFDSIHRNVKPNKDQESFMCAELVITCYQLAWLMLADESAQFEGPPEWMPLHAHSRPQKLTHFLEHGAFFEPLHSEIVSRVRYSGTPHPKDSRYPIVELQQIVPKPSCWSWNPHKRQGYTLLPTAPPKEETEQKEFELMQADGFDADNASSIGDYENPRDEFDDDENNNRLGKLFIGRLT